MINDGFVLIYEVLKCFAGKEYILPSPHFGINGIARDFDSKYVKRNCVFTPPPSVYAYMGYRITKNLDKITFSQCLVCLSACPESLYICFILKLIGFFIFKSFTKPLGRFWAILLHSQ